MKKRPQNENTKQIRIVVKAQALEQQTLGF